LGVMPALTQPPRENAAPPATRVPGAVTV
jgi:hypothetical protein